MKATLALALSLTATTLGFEAGDPLMKETQPVPSEAPAFKDNPTSPAKVELGQMLYFDPRLSQSHNISCNTCHQIGLGGDDGLPTSIGHKWQ